MNKLSGKIDDFIFIVAPNNVIQIGQYVFYLKKKNNKMYYNSNQTQFFFTLIIMKECNFVDNLWR